MNKLSEKLHQIEKNLALNQNIRTWIECFHKTPCVESHSIELRETTRNYFLIITYNDTFSSSPISIFGFVVFLDVQRPNITLIQIKTKHIDNNKNFALLSKF